jgi:hypothetical protein
MSSNPLPVYGFAMGVFALLIAFIACSRRAQVVALLTREGRYAIVSSEMNLRRRTGWSGITRFKRTRETPLTLRRAKSCSGVLDVALLGCIQEQILLHCWIKQA